MKRLLSMKWITLIAATGNRAPDDAVHRFLPAVTSAIGTFETCRQTLSMSVNGARPEVADRLPDGAFDPRRTSTEGPGSKRTP